MVVVVNDQCCALFDHLATQALAAIKACAAVIVLETVAGHQLYTAISTGRSDGMITMEQSLAEMVRTRRITRETALAHCFRADELRRYLQE